MSERGGGANIKKQTDNNSDAARNGFNSMLITFANRLDPGQAWRSVKLFVIIGMS